MKYNLVHVSPMNWHGSLSRESQQDRPGEERFQWEIQS